MKKKIVLYIMLFVFYPLFLYSQAPDTLWTHKYGGDSTEIAGSVLQTDDGGFVICGNTHSYGQGTPTYDNVYLVKIDENGDTLWTRVYEKPCDYAGYSSQKTDDGGFIIAGSVGLSGNHDGFLIKTDSLGDTLWTRIYPKEADDGFNCVQNVSALDSGFIMTGVCNDTLGGMHDIYLVRTDSLGIVLWSQTFNNAVFEGGYSVQQVNDGGFIIYGWTYGNSADCYLIKTDANGDTIWTRIFGGLSTEYGRCVQQTADGGYIMAGYSASFGPGDYDIYIVKTDSLGDMQWEKNYGGQGDQYCTAIRQTNDGGYICAGTTSDYYGNTWDAYVVKLTANGDSIWTIVLGLGGSRAESFYDIQITADGGYIAAGYAFSYGLTDMYVARISPDTLKILEKASISKTQILSYPTIICGPLLVPDGKNYRVFDIAGRTVLPDKIKTGIYFLEVEGVITKKFVKVR